jgi:hypothetical protein
MHTPPVQLMFCDGFDEISTAADAELAAKDVNAPNATALLRLREIMAGPRAKAHGDHRAVTKLVIPGEHRA